MDSTAIWPLRTTFDPPMSLVLVSVIWSWWLIWVQHHPQCRPLAYQSNPFPPSNVKGPQIVLWGIPSSFLRSYKKPGCTSVHPEHVENLEMRQHLIIFMSRCCKVWQEHEPLTAGQGKHVFLPPCYVTVRHPLWSKTSGSQDFFFRMDTKHLNHCNEKKLIF